MNIGWIDAVHDRAEREFDAAEHRFTTRLRELREPPETAGRRFGRPPRRRPGVAGEAALLGPAWAARRPDGDAHRTGPETPGDPRVIG
ncbi:hypothetical protein [Gordonia shandongensis]|uniref:hypothetical protein n=1 Tax=Gordonia shandongensis TaxID=376351 RepID=UPI0004060FCA|nr:hypothetical protein [Gordonia shandongensis]